MKSFDKANLGTMRQELNDALKAVEVKHGVKFDIGNIRYQSNNFRCRLECTIPGATDPMAKVNQTLGLPIVGATYTIGDPRNGRFVVKVIKNRRKKALVEIVERLGSGTRTKLNRLMGGMQMTVPFTMFK